MSFLSSAIATIVLVLPTLMHGTSVSALRTPTVIIVGGDSKIVTGNGDQYGLACKTKVANNVVYGYSGFLFVPSRQFAAADIVRPILNRKGSLGDRVAAIEKEINPRITELLTELRRGDIVGYDKLASKTVFAILFATVEDHVPKIMSFWYGPVTASITDPIVMAPTRYSCPGDCPDGSGYLEIGSRDASDADMAKYPSIFKQLGYVGATRHLIEDEVLDDPTNVGLPITIVRLSEGKIEWIEDSEPCKNDRQMENKSKSPTRIYKK
jgi:hypothetical protein